ncbi:MAG: hypothetical protein KDE46_20515, partial [Caldilineaceae bacterium]|nr:hypothetical protein [Caldilineaceae bacterium]
VQIIEPLPTARAFAAGVTGPNDVPYVLGGIDGSGNISAAVEAWNPNTQRWVRLPNLPTPRAAASAAADAVTQGLYVVGGTADLQTFAPLPTVEMYDVYSGRWSCSQNVNGCSNSGLAALPTPRSDLALTTGLDGRLWAIGGAQGQQTVATVEVYNPTANSWSTSEALPAARAAHGAVASAGSTNIYSSNFSSEGKIYVLGGQLSIDVSSATGVVKSYRPPLPQAPSISAARQFAYPSTYLPMSQDLLTLAERYDGYPTNTAFGNFTREDVDLQMPGYGPEIKIVRTYSSVYPRRGRFGWGWRSPFEMSVADTGSTVEVTREDGRVDIYAKQNGALIPPTGSVDRLENNGNGSYTLTTRQHLTYHFSSQGQLSRIEDADGNALTLEYSGQQWTALRDASGRRWVISTNGQGLISQIENPAGQKVSYAYNLLDELIAVTDPAGGVMHYNYDDQGFHQLINILDANGHLVVANWYWGDIDASGQWYGRVVYQMDKRTLNADRLHEFYYFDGATNEASDITAYVDPTGALSWSFYDADFQLQYKLDPLGDVSHFTYNGGVLVTSKTDGNGGTTRYTYDARGNLRQIEDPLGAVTRMEYDARDHLIRQVDARGYETTWRYDERDHLLEMTDAEGGVTKYTYDARGLRTSMTDALGHTTRYEYDDNGHQTAVIDPLGHATRFVYYASGQVKTKTDALGRTTTYTYDARNLLLTITAPDGGVTRYTYDAVGNRLTVT